MCKPSANTAAPGPEEEALARANQLSTESAEARVHAKTGTKHPHGERRAEIMRAHPEVASLFGPHLPSAAYSVALVALQFALAYLCTRHLPTWGWVLVAYVVGATVDHALWVLVHEATHNLIFRSVALNRAVLLLCNLPHVFPSAMMFRYYHILHHIELNRAYRDPDVPFEWEARLIGNHPVRKSVWLALFFVVQALRTVFYTYRVPRGAEVRWMAANWAVNVGVIAAFVHIAASWKPLYYLLVASVCSIGLHPLGARWIQEHYPTQPFQATYSYYGIANYFAFCIGYHVEHHDFPSVPWNRLADLKRLAPEYYDTLFAYDSYSELLRDFIMRREWSLSKRYEVEQEMAQKAPAGADAFTKKLRKRNVDTAQ